MYVITKKIDTETGHRLINYEGKCAHLHGHRYEWEVTVSAEHLDHRGMVIDYGDLKEILKDTIGRLDHAFVFHADDPLVQNLRGNETPHWLDATNGDVGRVILLEVNPTTENLLQHVADEIESVLPLELTLEHIRVHETSGSFADWYKNDSGGLTVP